MKNPQETTTAILGSGGQFLFSPPDLAPSPTVLYDRHLSLAGKSRLAPFAGHLMPLWYSSISAEHSAVRTAAGLFDCTHMGTLELSGRAAAEFLDLAATNRIADMPEGLARYAFLLDPAGNVLDDIIIYRRAADCFMLVVNAANAPKIKAWLSALLCGRVPGFSPPTALYLRDMKDTRSPSDCRCDIAIQGPASLDILSRLVVAPHSLDTIAPFHFSEIVVAGIDCLVARTGYTGSKTGFEIFLHPEKAPRLWDSLLEAGSPRGLQPCGLGARDSLRIEAGLPLYGHELDGDLAVSPFQAGYGWAIKLDKSSFIGKPAMEKEAGGYDREILRLELPAGPGIKPARPHDGVIHNRRCIGQITSCAKAADNQIALALVPRGLLKEGDPVGIYHLARNRRQAEEGRLEKLPANYEAPPDIQGRILPRHQKF